MSYPFDHSSVKVFFALWPTAAERGALSEWQVPLQQLCKGRAMRPETLHATLVFIGNVEESRLEALRLAAQEVGSTCFELCFDAVSYWEHNHIVYAAPDAVPPQLTELVGALELSLDKHHFRFDRRAYKPHVTLLRNARWNDAPMADNPVPTSGQRKLTLPLSGMQPVRWRMQDFALVQSVHQDGRAGYRVCARFPLRPSSG